MMKKIFKRMLSPIIFFIGIIFLILVVIAGGSESSSATAVNGVVYVEHWSSDSAYTHHYLSQRYGITESQIEGFIKSQGHTPEGRSSGKAFLDAQAKSGIDVRVLVAFAQAESAYGTAGVAKQYPEANIWGYGCFDNDPNQGRNWGPERAFNDFRTYQIEQLGNYNLQIMDERANQFALGVLPAGKGVYYTDTSGTGKARAKIMEDFDRYIDENGGTPVPPNGYGSAALAGGGSISLLQTVVGTYVYDGQCYMLTAWYSEQIGGPRLRGGLDKLPRASGMAAADIGTDYDWSQWGFTVILNPKASDIRTGDIINWKAGAQYSADSDYRLGGPYGHTAIVGEIKAGNKIMIYDQNPNPVSYREIAINDSMFSSLIRKGN